MAEPTRMLISTPKMVYTGKPEDAPLTIGAGVVFDLNKFAQPVAKNHFANGGLYVSRTVIGTFPVRIVIPPGYMCTMYTEGKTTSFFTDVDGVPFTFDWTEVTDRSATFAFMAAIAPTIEIASADAQ